MIRKIRRFNDVTQLEIATKLGVDRSTVAKWESGKSKPKTDRLLQLAAIFDCTVDDLLREDGDIDAARN